MVFVPETETDFATDPFFDIFGTATIEFGLGYDLDTNIIALMSVMLVSYVAHALGPEYEGAYDFEFGIREQDGERKWKVTAVDFTRETTAKYVSKTDRKLVLSLICTALKHLVRDVRPDSITMSTYYANLPPKGLRKYEPVCEGICECGYVQAECFDGADGRRNWGFKRK